MKIDILKLHIEEIETIHGLDQFVLNRTFYRTKLYDRISGATAYLLQPETGYFIKEMDLLILGYKVKEDGKNGLCSVTRN